MASSSPAPSPPLPLRIADPDGDVILVAGTVNPVSVRASSKVLGLASPVFKVMFGPNFWEGSQLSSTYPRHISLPEDHPEAMAHLCSILHFCFRIDEDITHALFEEVALLCDKYDCVHTVFYWSKSWLPHFTDYFFVKMDPEETRRRGLAQICTSYIYDNHDAFWNSTMWYMWASAPTEDQASFDFGQSTLSILLDMLPEGLIRHINDSRSGIALALVKEMENLIGPFLTPEAKSKVCYTSRESANPTSTSENLDPPRVGPAPRPEESVAPRPKEPVGCLRNAQIAHHFEELARLGLWPPTETLRKNPVQQTMDSMLEYRDFETGNYTVRITHPPLEGQIFGQYQDVPAGHPRSGMPPRCLCIRESFRSMMANIDAKHRCDVKGMCLACVKHNDKMARPPGNNRFVVDCGATSPEGHARYLEALSNGSVERQAPYILPRLYTPAFTR